MRRVWPVQRSFTTSRRVIYLPRKASIEAIAAAVLKQVVRPAEQETVKGAGSSAARTREHQPPVRVASMVTMGLAVFGIAHDFTAWGVATPAIEHDLHTNLSTAQWTVSAYAAVFGVVIVTGGRLADMIGRRTVLLVGATIFATSSLAGGLAADAPWLIASRAAMGAGGALMWPAIMGITYGLLPEAKAGLAGGMILGVLGFGNAIGPLLGGLLTSEVSWRWICFLNVLIVALGIIATLLFIEPDTTNPSRDHLDYRGATTLSVGLFALLLGLDLSSSSGWGSPAVLTLILIAPVALTLFAATQRRTTDHALLPRDVIGSRTFRASCGAFLFVATAFFAALLYVPHYLVHHLGWSALSAGVGLLPMMFAFGAVSFAAGPLYDKVGPRITVVSGAACIAAGTFALSSIGAGASYASLVPGLLVLGTGVGLFYSSISTAAVTAVDPSRSSVASGAVYTCELLGGSIGLVINTAIVVAAGSATAQQVRGMKYAFLLDGSLAVVAALVSVSCLRTRSRQEREYASSVVASSTDSRVTQG